MDHVPANSRRHGRFARKFEGAPAKLVLQIDAFRKRKLETHANRRGCEVSELIRGWLDPIIDALPEGD